MLIGGTVELGSTRIQIKTAGFIIALCDAIISLIFLWMVFTYSARFGSDPE